MQTSIPLIKSTNGSAGHELVTIEDFELLPGERKAIETGVSITECPKDVALIIKPKSGHAVKYGIDVLAGVVDSDYTGTIKVVLINHGSEIFSGKTGDKIAQLLVLKCLTLDNAIVQLTDSFQHTGFGSTSNLAQDFKHPDMAIENRIRRLGELSLNGIEELVMFLANQDKELVDKACQQSLKSRVLIIDLFNKMYNGNFSNELEKTYHEKINANKINPERITKLYHESMSNIFKYLESKVTDKMALNALMFADYVEKRKKEVRN